MKKLGVVVFGSLLILALHAMEDPNTFSIAIHGMERDIVEKNDPHSIFDLLQDNGRYLKKLIIADSNINYSSEFAIAQRTLRAFFDNAESKVRDKLLNCTYIYWHDEEDLTQKFGKEVIELAHTIVEQQKIRKSMFSIIFDGGIFAQLNDQNKNLKKLIQKCPAALNIRRYSHKSYGGTLTHYVAAKCNFFTTGEKGCSTLKILLEGGANPHILDKYNRSPLFYALKEGSTDAVMLLLRHKAQVNIQDYEGNTPLHYAVLRQHNKRKTTFELLCCGVDPNAANKWGDTPLHYVLRHCAGGKVVQCLLSLPKIDFFKCNKFGESYIDVAIKSRYSDYLTYLLFKVFSASYDNEENRCKDIARLIIAGADVNARNDYSAYHNYTYNKLGTLQDCTVLSYILHHKCEKCLRLLIEHNVDLNSHPDNNIHWSYIDVAIHYKFYNAVPILINAGVCIDRIDQHAFISLQRAALCEDEKAVKVLLDYGAFVNFAILNDMDKLSSQDIFELLKDAYENQQCCICFESQQALDKVNCVLSYIPCKINHRNNFICKKCYEGLKCIDGKKQCPFNCKEKLGAFNDYQ